MRRKSARNAQKATPDKAAKETEPVPKTRRSRRRKRSPSKSSESEEEILTVTKRAPLEDTPDTTTKSHTPSDEETSEEPIWKVTSSEDSPKGEIQKLKLCLTRPSPDSPDKTKSRRSKSNSQTEDDATSSEDKSARRTRSQGSPIVRNDGLSSQEGDEDVEEKKGKGKSKGKHKSKIEKSPHLSEPDVQTNNEISENVQVTPQSPSIDKPVDNENDHKVDADDIQKVNENVEKHENVEETACNNGNEQDKINVDKSEAQSEDNSQSKASDDDDDDDEPLSVIKKSVNESKIAKQPEVESEPREESVQTTQENVEVSHEDVEISHQDVEVSREDVEVSREDVEVSHENVEVSHEDVEISHQHIEQNKPDDETTTQSEEIETPIQSEKEGVNEETVIPPQIEPEVVEKDNRTGDENQREVVEDTQIENVPENNETKEISEKPASCDVEITETVNVTEETETAVAETSDAKICTVEKSKDVSPPAEDNVSPPVDENSSSPVPERNRSPVEEENQRKIKERAPRLRLKRSNEYITPSSQETAENNNSETSHITPSRIKRKWGGDSKLTSSLIRLDLESIQSVCPTIDFPEEPDLKLEIEKERRKSLSDSSGKKLERKVSVEYKSEFSERPTFEKQTSVNSTKDGEDNSNIIAFNRKISIVDDTASKLKPPPSPAKNPISNILYITNLVRPFTVKQLKELLERTGKIQEDGFWTDRIKSKCYVQYESQEEAEATRTALHGVQWPIGNGKKLIIDYATEEDLQKAKNPPAPPPAAAPVPETKTTTKENQEPVESKQRTEEKTVKESEKKRVEGPVREWDIGKKDIRRDRSRSKERTRKHRRSPSPSDDFITRKQRKTEESVPQKLMDDLFLKTKATPSIYWQPLSPEEISMKQQQRLIRMEEHKRRMEENSRMKSREMGRGAFRRRYD